MRASEAAAEEATQSTGEGGDAADIVLAYDLSFRQSLLSTTSTEPATRKLEKRTEQQVLLGTALSPEHEGDVLEEVVVSSKLGEVLEHPAQKELEVVSVRRKTSVLVVVVFSILRLHTSLLLAPSAA
ncbi:hypothetical protein PI124_g5467 [Phytophthora idaei]|nr:hypothetical protein PI124_g5467 [Phytophthora idaei]